jgi:hypothetical protein
LLGLVEAVNLVGEENRSAAKATTAFRLRDDFAHARDPFGHGGEWNELAIGVLCDDARDRRLSSSRWTPEHDRADAPLLDRLTQRFAGREEMTLADDFVQRAWTHARGERLRHRSLEERRSPAFAG